MLSLIVVVEFLKVTNGIEVDIETKIIFIQNILLKPVIMLGLAWLGSNADSNDFCPAWLVSENPFEPNHWLKPS